MSKDDKARVLDSEQVEMILDNFGFASFKDHQAIAELNRQRVLDSHEELRAENKYLRADNVALKSQIKFAGGVLKKLRKRIEELRAQLAAKDKVVEAARKIFAAKNDFYVEAAIDRLGQALDAHDKGEK